MKLEVKEVVMFNKTVCIIIGLLLSFNTIFVSADERVRSKRRRVLPEGKKYKIQIPKVVQPEKKNYKMRIPKVVQPSTNPVRPDISTPPRSEIPRAESPKIYIPGLAEPRIDYPSEITFGQRCSTDYGICYLNQSGPVGFRCWCGTSSGEIHYGRVIQ